MRKRIRLFAVVLCVALCTACGDEMEQEKNSFQELKAEVSTELEAAKNGKYENLNITCDEVRLPKSGSIQSMKFPIYTFTKNMTLHEKLDFYKDEVYTKMYDLETVDGKCVIDIDSKVYEADGFYYKQDYNYLIEFAEDDNREIYIGYYNAEKYQFMETIPEGICMNVSFGTLGTMFQNKSPFLASDWEMVKSYDCYLDDLSDSYLLMDGEKTVAEAKVEIEQWLDVHYPLVGEDNGIRNEVYQISVRKIPNSEYHVFHARRTLSYDGLRVREYVSMGLPSENGVMGEAYMCESGKVDLMMGFVNCFEKGNVIKDYEEFISFEEALSSLSYYLTDDTKFNVGYIGMEYRMFTEKVENTVYYNWIPYWCFLMENPNDDSMLRIYMNMETGEFE